MKRFFLTFVILLSLPAAAFGQGEAPFRKTFSLEAGVGQGPLHMTIRGVCPDGNTESALAEQGRQALTNDGIYPSLTLSGAFRTWDRWETVVTGCISWSHCRIVQYEVFGIDPKGKPRFDLTKEIPVGWADLCPKASLTVQERVFWNPRWKVQMYSALGLGLSQVTEFIPLPSFMPVCCRLGGRYLYFYAEAGFSPFASVLHGGLGWKF